MYENVVPVPVNPQWIYNYVRASTSTSSISNSSQVTGTSAGLILNLWMRFVNSAGFKPVAIMASHEYERSRDSLLVFEQILDVFTMLAFSKKQLNQICFF